MSHFKNMQSYEKLMGICTGYGESYKPGQQHLQVNALAALGKSAQESLKQVQAAKVLYEQMVANRNQAFKNLPSLSAAIWQALKASRVDDATMADVLACHRAIYGFYKAKPVVEASADAPEGTKRSKVRGYQHVWERFDYLVEIVSAIPNYRPGIAHLTVAGLKAKLDQLRKAEEEVNAAAAMLKSARVQRDEVFYSGIYNMLETYQGVKAYIRAAFGFKSPKHDEVLALSFTKYY